MSFKESSANTLVRFTGMGIINFNNGSGDISIIRDEKHTFAVRIQEPRFKDGVEKDIIIYEDIAVYESLSKEGIEIEIGSASNSKSNSYEVYKNGEGFNRLDAEDLNDFRWIVDLDDLHTNQLSKVTAQNQYPLTNLSIKNGFFYTHKLDTDLFFEKITKDTDGKEEGREVFGHIAETIGVKIEAETVEFKIKMGDESESHILENKGLPYRIEINNIDYNDESEISDMPEYYKYLSSQSGRQFELAPMKEDEEGNIVSGGSVNALSFCHPAKGGG